MGRDTAMQSNQLYDWGRTFCLKRIFQDCWVGAKLYRSLKIFDWGRTFGSRHRLLQLLGQAKLCEATKYLIGVGPFVQGTDFTISGVGQSYAEASKYSTGIGSFVQCAAFHDCWGGGKLCRIFQIFDWTRTFCSRRSFS